MAWSRCGALPIRSPSGQTTARAPTAGYVTQLFLRPGMTASTSLTMIFVHQGDRTLSAAFPQEVVQRLRPGAEAEIAFDAIPGRVFPGRVSVMLDAVSQGQLQASGTLLDPQSRAQSPGLVSVNVDITDHLTGYQLPAGASTKGRRLQRPLEGRGYRPAHPAADEELAKLPRLRPLG